MLVLKVGSGKRGFGPSDPVCKVSVSEVTVKASLHRSRCKSQIAKCWPPGGSLTQPMQGKVRPSELEGMGLPPINSKDGQRGCKSEDHFSPTENQAEPWAVSGSGVRSVRSSSF